MKHDSFAQFLETFVPVVEKKSKMLNQASWLLEITGSSDAADLRAGLDEELRLLYHDAKTYEKLLKWEESDPLLSRQLNVLRRSFKQNQIPKDLLEKISQSEAAISLSYASFRPEIDGKPYSENQLREVLKKENNVSLRKAAWEASKKIGEVVAPQILSLVRLRNQAAHHLGYSDYFEMQLDLQEVKKEDLLKIFDELSQKSDQAYSKMLAQIQSSLAKRFSTSAKEPWFWSEPFCQEDPLDAKELDTLLDGIDIPAACTRFYGKMGFDVESILARSDMFEREGKCQHAFCTNIDRKGDVRTLNNVKPSIKWLETVLHELGHAVYDLGYDSSLPWLLREPPHMITTEAMALLAGRQAYRVDSLKQLLGKNAHDDLLIKAETSLSRRQLIFSRWVLVMTAFERELYRDPAQDLNGLWWSLVEKYQGIHPPKGREKKADWAAKVHIGTAPVYYFSYLLGELFASSIEEALGRKILDTPKAGRFLQEKLFAPGDLWSWDQLITRVSGPLTPDAWLKEFAK